MPDRENGTQAIAWPNERAAPDAACLWDAATLILIDERDDDYFVLMGRRHERHAFMPGKFVFPGGRTDPTDGQIAVSSNLHPAEAHRIAGGDENTSTARSKAIALSALRETYEEAGLLVGEKAPLMEAGPPWRDFLHHGVRPSLSSLRFIARAITPPGNIRRFDTRFLATRRKDIAVELATPPTDELQDIGWFRIDEAMQLEIPRITYRVLRDLQTRLSEDPLLSPGWPVPFYFMQAGRFQREVL